MAALSPDVMDLLTVTAVVSAVPLGVSLVVGLIVSVLQAATQIQEQTLTFVPKVIAVGMALWFTGGWMMEELGGVFSNTLVGVASDARRDSELLERE